jgi:imidazolonepropionase
MALDVLSEVGAQPGVPSISATFLGAHALPPGFEGDVDEYVNDIASWFPQVVERGARHVDVFCDEGYFTIEQSRTLLLRAKAAGLRTRIHADELARTGGALLAAEIGADSADHLLRITTEDAAAMGNAGVVAVLCPGTALAMGCNPPVAELRRAQVTMALGSDHNPGTCGTTDMTIVVAVAVSVLGMSVHEALCAATSGSARSLGYDDRGLVVEGKRADLVIWSADHEGAFAWSWGLAPLQVIKGGSAQRFDTI